MKENLSMMTEEYREAQAYVQTLAEREMTMRIEALRLACDLRYVDDTGLAQPLQPNRIALSAARFLDFLKTGQAPVA